MARNGRTLGRWMAIGAGGLVAALALLVVAAVVLLDSGAVTERVVALVLPRASEALGRAVTLDSADLSLFPATRVRLQGLAVAGRAGEAPLVRAEAVDVAVGLWPLLRSRGRELDVRSVALVKPIVTLTRAPDGTWSHEGLGKQGGAPAEEPPPAGGDAARVAVRELRVEGGALRLVDRSGGKDDAGLAVESLDVRASGIGAGLPAAVRIGAALGGGVQNVFAELSVARVPAAIPARAEDWPAIQGSLRIGALALDRVRALLPAALGAIARGGTVSLDASVTTVDHLLHVDGTGRLEDLRLRGQAASGRFRAAARLSPARPGAGRVDLTELVLRGPGVDLGGHASLELEPLRGWFVVTGPLLDLDALMGVLPEGDAPDGPARPGGPLLPAAMRARVNAAAITGTVAIQAVKGGRLEATDVRGKARLAGGTLALQALDAAVYGGRVDAGGTEIALGAAEPSWKLDAALSGVDLAKALQAFSGAAPLQGKVTGKLAVRGRGTQWEKIRDGLTGLAALSLAEGALTTTDVGDEVLGALAQGLSAAGAKGVAAKAGGARGGRTEIRDLAGSFRVRGGALEAEAPFAFDAPFGKVTLGGKVGLDGRLDLRGVATVPRSALGGGVTRALPRTLEVPIGLQGTLGQPSVAVDASAALSGAGRAAAGKVRGEAERAGRRAVGDFLKGLGGKRR